jgi:hypothetical protein
MMKLYRSICPDTIRQSTILTERSRYSQPEFMNALREEKLKPTPELLGCPPRAPVV